MPSEHHTAIHSMMRQMAKSVIGQEEVVRTLTLALLCNGNVLLEGLPGTAKARAERDSLNREREALLKVQRMRFWLAVGGAGVVGFSLGALTTYQIACSLRPRR